MFVGKYVRQDVKHVQPQFSFMHTVCENKVYRCLIRVHERTTLVSLTPTHTAYC